MALTKTPIELSSTPSIVDGGNATAITIDSSENVGIGASPLTLSGNAAPGLTVSSNGPFILLQDANNADKVRYISNNTGELQFGIVGDDGATGKTEHMRIDASGNLLVGTTTHRGFSGSTTEITIGTASTGATAGGAVTFDSGSGFLGYLAFQESEGTLGTLTSVPLVFKTGNTERMRINAGGQLLIGTTTGVATGTLATSGLEIVAPSGQDAIATQVLGGATCFGGSGPTTSSQTYLFGQMINSSGSTVGSIVVSASATAYNTSSDYRLKENVVAISNATERLKQLNPSRFNFIEVPDKTVDGFLAHEVQAVVPEAISGTKDAMRDEEYEVTPAVLDDDGNVTTEAVMGTRSVPDYQGIDQSKLVPLLVATIQELEARLTALENN